MRSRRSPSAWRRRWRVTRAAKRAADDPSSRARRRARGQSLGAVFIDVIHSRSPQLVEPRGEVDPRAYDTTPAFPAGSRRIATVGRPAGSRAAAKVRERAESARRRSDPSFVEDLVAFLEDESFWVTASRCVRPLRRLRGPLGVCRARPAASGPGNACGPTSSSRSSRGRSIGTTMWLIDPRVEQWTLDAVKKSYLRWQELRHRRPP